MTTMLVCQQWSLVKLALARWIEENVVGPENHVPVSELEQETKRSADVKHGSVKVGKAFHVLLCRAGDNESIRAFNGHNVEVDSVIDK